MVCGLHLNKDIFKNEMSWMNYAVENNVSVSGGKDSSSVSFIRSLIFSCLLVPLLYQALWNTRAKQNEWGIVPDIMDMSLAISVP